MGQPGLGEQAPVFGRDIALLAGNQRGEHAAVSVLARRARHPRHRCCPPAVQPGLRVLAVGQALRAGAHAARGQPALLHQPGFGGKSVRIAGGAPAAQGELGAPAAAGRPVAALIVGHAHPRRPVGQRRRQFNVFQHGVQPGGHGVLARQAHHAQGDHHRPALPLRRPGAGQALLDAPGRPGKPHNQRQQPHAMPPPRPAAQQHRARQRRHPRGRSQAALRQRHASGKQQ